MDFFDDDGDNNDGFGSEEGPPQLEPSSGSGSGAPAGGDGVGNDDDHNNNNEDSNAEPSAAESESAVESSRWTCDACGCNTNASTDRSCTVCGTPNGKFSICFLDAFLCVVP